MNDPSPAAVLVDVDGTLVDSNYLHALAWHRAFRDAAGRHVPTVRLHRLVGMGSDQLVAAVLGDDHQDAAAVADAYDEAIGPLKDEVWRFEHADELLRTLADRGLTVVLATSARPEDVDLLTETVGAGDAVAAVVHSGDVDASKPDAQIFAVALEKAGCPPERAVVIGDTVYDIEAAGKLGVPCIALTCGGIGAGELQAAGAAAVYESPADLLAHLADSPLAGLG